MPLARAAEATTDASAAAPAHTADELASTIRLFLAGYPTATVLEDGKITFDLASAQHAITTDGNRCTLQLWSGERSLVRTVVAAELRRNALRLSTQRFGQPGTKLLQLRADTQPRSPSAREPARKGYQRRLERALARAFPDWQPDGFRTAMDLERSFGPAYARGSLVHGREAWAVIGAGATESQTLIDGILTFGILWLHHNRERGDGRRLYKGLRVVVPRGTGALSQARIAWLNTAAAQWQLWELDEATEELTELDPADHGNLRTRLLHLPDETVARERFAPAIAQLMALVPPGEHYRVEQRLRSPAELAFLLHGLEFAHIRLQHQPGSFRQILEITCGHGPAQTLLTQATASVLQEHIAELFRRRDASATESFRPLRPRSPARSIGAFTGKSAHGRSTDYVPVKHETEAPLSRLEQRERRLEAQNDPLFRAAPERWLESMLRENLAPLTRSLAARSPAQGAALEAFANDPDPDTRGNRAEPPRALPGKVCSARERVIPRFNPQHVYSQVPAIAGASDRGMLDLLGVTADGRLAVIELKASDDIQLPLQGLDYWIRVSHHHRQPADLSGSGNAEGSDLQRHGYFRDVALSAAPPRLYLVAPALGIHPAAETVLRYFSPRVEWSLIALDERWRQGIRVVWRKSGGRAEKL